MLEIIVDTREKHPWTFDMEDDVKVINKGLPFGDYMVKGIDDFVVERKATSAELYYNVVKHKDRFFREMERLTSISRPYIICEFPQSRIYEFPENSGIPLKTQAKLKAGKKFFASQINKIENMGIPFLFCRDKYEAEDVFLTIARSLKRE